MISDKIKIFPLLVIVALMAFSVRLAEVATGLSSGSAFAEEKPDESALAEPGKTVETKPEAAPAEAKPEETPAAKAEEKPQAAKDAKVDPKLAAEKAKGEEVIWKDAGDSDIDTSTTVKMEMFEDLAKRRDAIDAREKDLKTREALIKAAEQELDRKYQELETIRSEIKGLLVEQSEEEKKRIGSLVTIYEGMKAKQAASIFNTLDIDVLVDVMTAMSERKVSPILAEMDPERARTITIIMAEQKKLPELPESN